MTTANQAEQWFRDRLRSPQVLHPLFQPAKDHHKLKKKICENNAGYFSTYGFVCGQDAISSAQIKQCIQSMLFDLANRLFSSLFIISGSTTFH